MQILNRDLARQTGCCRRRTEPGLGVRSLAAAGLGLLLLLVIGALTASVPAAQEPESTRETIVYSSIQPANWDLYLFDGPGSEPRRLTTDPGLDYNPAVSPDGRWVVFTSERSGSPDLYVLDLEGDGAPRPLVEGPALEDAADISPNGQQLLFVSTRSGNADVFVMPFRPEDPHGAGGAKNLTRHAAGDYNPTFSPDGTRILFSSSRDAAVATSDGASPPATYLASELYVMQADGTDVRRLTAPREVGRHTRVDAGRAGRPLLLATGRGDAHLPHRHRRRRGRAGLGAGRGGALADGRAGRAARVHGAPGRPLDDRHHPGRRLRPAGGERCRARLLGSGLRPDLGPPAGARAAAARPDVPVRERRAGGVPHPPAVPHRPAGPPGSPDRHPGLPAGHRSHQRRGRHQRGVLAPRGVAARRDGKAGPLRSDRGGSLSRPRIRLGALVVEGRAVAGVHRRAAVRLRRGGRRHLEDPQRRQRRYEPDAGLRRQRRPARLPPRTAAASSSAACGTATPRST